MSLLYLISGQLEAVHLQTDGAARIDTGLVYKGTIPTMMSASVCSRMFITQARFWISFISYATKDTDNEFLIGKMNNNFFGRFIYIVCL